MFTGFFRLVATQFLLFQRASIVLCFVLLCSAKASAAWTLIYDGHDDHKKYYDPSSRKFVGKNMVNVFELTNYNSEKNDIDTPYYSVIKKLLINCKDESSQILWIGAFSEHFGGGRVVHSANADNNPEGFSYFIPGSVGYDNLKLYCRKK